MTDADLELRHTSDLVSWETVSTEVLEDVDLGSHRELRLRAVFPAETETADFISLLVTVTPTVVDP